MWIYLNDRFVSEEEALVSVFDYGFLYGDGLFETLRVYNGTIFALDAHLKRLSDSAERLHLPIPPPAFLKSRLYETIERNLLEEALIRLTLSRGMNRAALRPDLCKKGTMVITARPFSKDASADLYENGVSATILSMHRTSPAGRGPAVKSLSFLNNILGKLEIKEKDLYEGIFLDGDDFLSEGIIHNLFWIRKGVLRTPVASSLIIEGVTRKILIELAKESGMPVEEGCYRVKELFDAEEAFLSNTVKELVPLTQVDGKNIGTGQPGPTSRKLQRLFQERVKKDCEG